MQCLRVYTTYVCIVCVRIACMAYGAYTVALCGALNNVRGAYYCASIALNTGSGLIMLSILTKIKGIRERIGNLKRIK